MKNQRIVLFLIIILSTVLITINIISNNLPDDKEDGEVPTLYVSGEKIMDGLGREVRVKGFRLMRNKILYNDYNGKYTHDDFIQIKDWGFNLVEIDMNWGKQLEPYEDQPGFYDLDFFDQLDPIIRMADQEELYVVLSVRVVNSDNAAATDSGWGRNYYVSTEEGLERYAKCIEFFVNEVIEREWTNVIAFEPYQFPFHQSTPNETQISFYYQQVRPRLVQAIRKHSNMLIILPTMQCRIEYFDDPRMVPLSESNILYSFSFYDYFGMTHGDGPILEWDHDINFQLELVQPLINWKEKYNKPLFCTEWGIRGDTQSQVDLAGFKAGLLESLGASWLYHSYENYFQNHFGILYSDNSSKPILEALLDYNKTIYE